MSALKCREVRENAVSRLHSDIKRAPRGTETTGSRRPEPELSLGLRVWNGRQNTGQAKLNVFISVYERGFEGILFRGVMGRGSFACNTEIS
jgi:hypothetical protein